MKKTKNLRNKVKNQLMAGVMLGGMAFSGLATTLIHADTSSSTDDKWGTAADDKEITTSKGTDGKTINLLDQEHANYNQSTPFYAPLTFPNDETLKTAGFTEDVVDGLVFDGLKVYKVDKTIQSNDDLKDIDLSKAKDVTNQGTVEKHSNGEKWTFKNAQDAFGQSFVVEVKAHLSADGAADLTKYADKTTGVIKIPNTIEQFWNDHKTKTPTPHIIPPKTVDPKVDKKIVNTDGKLVDKRAVDFDHDYTYLITNNVGSNVKLDSIESADDMEDVIDLKSVKVVDGDKVSGKDISSQFNIKIDNDKESYVITPKAPKDWANKTWSIALTGRLKNTPKLMDYLTKNGVEVGNKATLKVNDKVKTTPTVIVTPPLVKDQAKKFIEQTSDKAATDADKGSTDDKKSSSSASASSDKASSSSSTKAASSSAK